MLRRTIFVFIVLLTTPLSFLSVWADSEEQSLSSKVGPLLKNDIRDAVGNTPVVSGESLQSREEAPRANLIKVIVVMATDHLEPLSDTLVAELKERVEGLRGHIGNYAFNNVQAWIPVDQINELAEWSEIKMIRKPIKPSGSSIKSEGLETIGAPSWHDIAIKGQGVKIGIIDLGFEYFGSLLGSELSPAVTTSVYGSYSDFSGSIHGTACAEIVYDVAPEVEMFLANVSDISVDFHNAVSWFESQKVDVISSSIGINLKLFCGLMYFAVRENVDPLIIGAMLDYLVQLEEQWGLTIDNAVSNGITWVQAAGNDGRRRWKGRFGDSDGDHYLVSIRKREFLGAFSSGRVTSFVDLSRFSGKRRSHYILGTQQAVF